MNPDAATSNGFPWKIDPHTYINRAAVVAIQDTAQGVAIVTLKGQFIVHRKHNLDSVAGAFYEGADLD